MENNIEVSIICNTYNHEKYIKDALEGFVCQKTNFAFEVLVHDDASTDRTADIIREYEQRYPNLIKPIYQTENQYHKHDGTISILQSKRSQGKYVATCEGDDYWTDPLKLQKQYDFMEAHPDYTLCGCSTEWLNSRTGKREKRSKTDMDKDISFEEFLMPENARPFPFVSFFMRTEIWKTRPFWGFPVGDLPLTYYAAMKGKVRMLADTMCVYRWFAEGSWTVRAYNDEDRLPYQRQFLRGLEVMNEQTNYQYNDLIQQKIKLKKYALAIYQHDFAAVKSEELVDIYRNKPFVLRMKDWLHCRMPGLYWFIMNRMRKL